MPAQMDWRAAVELRPEGTPTEEQDPQRRQHPHQKPYRELGINWIPVYVHFTCAYVYVRISYVLLDMCEAYVR